MEIKSYRDLVVWQKADDLAFKIYKLTDSFPKKYLYDLTNQLRRAALSVPTNIAEGCGSNHSGELIQFINIAHRSLSETRYLLEFSHRLDLLEDTTIHDLEKQCGEIARMLGALTRSIRERKSRS
jgi:four helix bundle protein